MTITYNTTTTAIKHMLILQKLIVLSQTFVVLLNNLQEIMECVGHREVLLVEDLPVEVEVEDGNYK